MAVPYHELFRSDRFRRYYGAYVLFVIGNSLTTVVAPLIVLAETGSASLTAITATVGYFPFLLFGLVAGSLSDNLNKQLIMVTAALAAGVAVLVPLFFRPGAAQLVAVILLVKFMVGIAEVWHTVTHFGTLPFLVQRSQLAEAAAVLQSSHVVINLVAPLGSIVVLQRFGHRPVFAVIGAIFLLSALLRSLGTDDNGGITPTTYRDALSQLGPNVAEGFRVTFGNPLIRLITVTGFLGSVGYGVVNALIAVYLFLEFDIEADDPMQGIFLTAGAVGVLGLMWLLPFIRRWLAPALTIGLIQCFVMLTSIGLALSRSLSLSLVVFALFSGWGSVMFTNLISLRMEMLPLALQGRVGSVSRLFASGGIPVGGIAAGLVLPAVGIRRLFLATVLIWGLSLVVAWRHRGLQGSGLVESDPPKDPSPPFQPGVSPLAAGRVSSVIQADQEPA